MRIYSGTADLTMRKTHTCCYCGAVYTYVLERRVAPRGAFTRNGAEQLLNKKAAEVWRNGAEIKPCPNCGRCQSEMFADSTWSRFDTPGVRLCAFCAPLGALLYWLASDGMIREKDDVLFLAGMFVGPWLYFTARLAPTFRNWNRNPERNIEKMKTKEKWRSEILGIRQEYGRKQNVKRGRFIGSTLWYAAFSFFLWALLGICLPLPGLEKYSFGAPYVLFGLFVTALGFFLWIKNVPDSVRFQGDKPLTTNANEETTALLREHWRELLEARETQEATRKD